MQTLFANRFFFPTVLFPVSQRVYLYSKMSQKNLYNMQRVGVTEEDALDSARSAVVTPKESS